MRATVSLLVSAAALVGPAPAALAASAAPLVARPTTEAAAPLARSCSMSFKGRTVRIYGRNNVSCGQAKRVHRDRPGNWIAGDGTAWNTSMSKSYSFCIVGDSSYLGCR